MNATPLSREEEAALFKEYALEETSEERKNIIRTRIIESNAGFVYAQAKGYAKRAPNLADDLVSAGFEGLIVAFDKFDPSRQGRFLSYAGFWVREKILKTLAGYRLVAVPIVNQQIQAKIGIYESKGLTREEILEKFPASRSKLVEDLLDKEFLTYYLEEIDSPEENVLDVDIDAPDKTKIRRIVEEAPPEINEVLVRHFYDGGRAGEKELETALKYMREKLGEEDSSG